jgi:hypothetical protein
MLVTMQRSLLLLFCLLLMPSVPTSVGSAPPDPPALMAWSVQQAAGPTWNDPRFADFFEALTTNEAWMHALLDSGPLENGPRVLAFLARLWEEDPGLASRPIDRSMATACALELRAGDRDEDWMQSRYDYFRDHHADGLLNRCYDELETWERRFLARGPQYPSWTAPEALTFLRERICWPRSEYVSACWQAPYRGFNCFGDTVQGWLYYHPFRGAFRCDPEMTIEVGGVCGALSNMGAAAAIANGIPALTMGEPGHCAYAVQTAPGVWTPAYSLSWKRGLHSALYRGTWPSHQLAQASFDRRNAVAAAGDKARLARWQEAEGEISRADAAWRSALTINGLDEGHWVEYLRFGARHDRDASWWRRTIRLLQESLLPDHPEVAWVLLKDHVFATILGDASVRDRTTLFNQYLGKLEGWGSGRWDIESAWNWMLKRVGDERQQRQFVMNLLRDSIDSPDLGPPFISWTSSRFEDDEDARGAFENILLSKTRRSGEGEDLVLRQMAKTMLPAAAEAHDLETFQRIGKAASRLFEPRPSLAEAGIEPFPGILLSSGGALRIWEPGNRWDSPEAHWGVLEERGGNFHTQVGDTPWFEVELPQFGEIEGIILEGRRGQAHRGADARILVSRDGVDWEQVATLEGAHVWYRVDLSETRPRARFIRVERDGKCMHFPRVLVYGRRSS